MMDLPTRAAQLFTVGFFGRSLSSELAVLLERGVGGVVFFARNVGSPPEVATLCAEIKRAAGRPLTLAVDQEGGLVARLKLGFTPLPSMRALGATGDESLAFELGRLLGHELRAVGFDMNFAPVLDVDTNPDNPVIGTRSLGRDPELVGRLGVAVARGIQDSGVAACAKHFPGHGDTTEDSHLALPRLPHSIERLEAIELPPFRAAVDAGIASIMTAHVIFSPLDGTFPATMSQAVVSGILRDGMGFDGVVVSDDIEMKAIADHYGVEETVVRGLNAGVDQFLCCHTAELAHRGIDAVVKAVESGIVPEARLFEANRRNTALASRYAAPASDSFDSTALRSPEHLDLVERILSRAGASAAKTGVDPTEVMEQVRLLRRGGHGTS
jgi:beta-N-acetylhexosaminidase